ncbi:Zinc finger, ZZ type [Musa troglodytarum]|uniref:Zinc finger, ZZ type n=1 Tax=Musa troglodytarum TaxID=320322 RepID=A0A9E7ET05_9LILI|nr:Zinc finger, ZZ type [Musa troglodytarum]
MLIRAPKPGVLGKRKDREPSDPTGTQSQTKAEPRLPEEAAAARPTPVEDNRLLAGLLAQEFLTRGTLFGKRWRGGKGSDPARPPGGTEEGPARPGRLGYAEVSYLLKSDAAHIAGVFNPTQLSRWLHINDEGCVGWFCFHGGEAAKATCSSPTAEGSMAVGTLDDGSSSHFQCCVCLMWTHILLLVCEQTKAMHKGEHHIALYVGSLRKKSVFDIYSPQPSDQFDSEKLHLDNVNMSIFHGRGTLQPKKLKAKVPCEAMGLWLNEDMSAFHVGVVCDSCEIYLIIGKQYKCKDWKEAVGFDLREACYNTISKLPGRFNQQHTPDHKFEPHMLRNILMRKSQSVWHCSTTSRSSLSLLVMIHMMEITTTKGVEMRRI